LGDVCPGVVDQDMEGVVAVMELGCCGADRVLVGEVQRQHFDAGVAGAGDHGSGGLPTGPLRPGGQDDGGAAPGEVGRDD
jgi:hypothetical protein